MFVDHIIFTIDCLLEIERIKGLLNVFFKIKDHGELKYFIGLEVAKSKKGIHLCQSKYTLETLIETGMLASNPCLHLLCLII